MSTITVTSIISASKKYQYVDNGDPMRGGMKDVYFSPNKQYVVAIYRDKQDYNAIERLKKIATTYYESFFNREGGDYYKKLYAWPTDVVQVKDKIGIIVPCYSQNFFFKKGYENITLLEGKEKEGKWFASAKFRSKTAKLKLDKSELGNWLSYFQICVNISRGVKRMHSAGLAHSDLSYKNVLIDPVTKTASIIDIDGLVVPGLYPPDVIGTADFIAPEVLATKNLNVKDPDRNLPNRYTDLHALSVLIYMYLFYRHPLRGGNYFGAIESDEEEDLLMGSKALFIEHPTNASNRNFKREYGENIKNFQPWTDLDKTPYTIAGPYLEKLFEQAFIKGLSDPRERPLAESWEQALIKTDDLKLKCSNNDCDQQWFIFDNSKITKCPFCTTKYENSIPILDLFYEFKTNVWKPENQRLVICNNTTLHKWHVDRSIIRNEKLDNLDKKRVGYFVFHNKQWLFINESLKGLKDVTNNNKIGIGESVVLQDGNKLLLSEDNSGRLVNITITNQ
ncbi:helix-hairpin-helix domain-containing protein [Tenacibaculum finnmarkense]|uniref:helix-hairpin-helix domain-containing protein n=1 Tax=Tenacibaculum finnmarkense TaxID=2781243 RepID=UPI00187BB6BA|nr:kinase [Tenacibaculum finnmarkense]MBE7648261.1 kinase [Tenacibaculum finnmarkense genomovar ulcerans]MCD8422881.1 kinase [Tenacibaculum finnmarkense genomovar ulcerans]MCD8432791.1 kinase [Tenacibaculum finnmarkense genomovar ulcerans]MCG8238886.1 kinase [Tenacibaculum finnmarkense genomovar ulcerans]